MRVLVLHSDVRPDAPADELDTLVTAGAVADALSARGHQTCKNAFNPEPVALATVLDRARAEAVFNLVESVYGNGMLACLAPAMLEQHGIPYTGASAACIALTADKTLSKRLLRQAGLATPDWVEPPFRHGLSTERRYVVKSMTEDASLGLDEGAVVTGTDVPARARLSSERHGGRWFAEAYLDGREFNVALLEEEHGVRVLPIPEMRFVDWRADRPRIVGYAAKWDDASDEARKTVRSFGVEDEQPALAERLVEMARKTWVLLRMRGYARVDFRLDADGTPMILEVNPNPCLEPHAGFAAAAAHAGISFADLVEQILQTARRS